MEDIKDIVLEYVKEEYLEDEDEELTYETPLISATPEAFDSVSKIAVLVREIAG